MKNKIKKEKIRYSLFWVGGKDDKRSHINLFKDSDGFWWVDFLKNNYWGNFLKRKEKCYGSFLISFDDVQRIKDWVNRDISDITDGDSMRITCGCAANCSIIEFVVDKTDRCTPHIFAEYYIHANYRGNIKCYMTSEVCLSFNELSLLVQTIENYKDVDINCFVKDKVY